MTCSSCGHNLHLGKSCSGIAESTFAAMNTEKKIKWTCKICRTKGARSGEEAVDVNSEVRSLDDPGLLGAQIQLMNRKLDSLPSLKVSVDSLLELPAKVTELLLLKPAIELLKTTVEEVQISITALGKKDWAIAAAATIVSASVHRGRPLVRSSIPSGSLKAPCGDWAVIAHGALLPLDSLQGGHA
ncbi:hypothetical protein HPB47_009003 [Ixodes persulcatus]|uniref:Uncharacterized protein n=1 Tax=Ixodes persulcatus TaxID=34615 RepID=A0AC60P377_IXOPE|nr:hypothetical protein HPB47_009003 [Ixodes persulcatus]